MECKLSPFLFILFLKYVRIKLNISVWKVVKTYIAPELIIVDEVSSYRKFGGFYYGLGDSLDIY